VGKAAMETSDYLVSAFNEKNLRLKAITSKGSLLDNINFISETFESQVLILILINQIDKNFSHFIFTFN
jgi:hypothetical protein